MPSTAVRAAKWGRGVSVVLLVACTMCKQQEPAPAPSAEFIFRGNDKQVLTLATYDTCTVVSTGQAAQTVHWDFGNGTQAGTRQVVLSYPVAGTYPVQLTATNEAGETRTETKTVRVLDRVLKRIIVNRVYWSPVPGSMPNFNATWPLTTTADVYAQIQERTAATTFPAGGLVPDAPVLFTSAVVPAVYCDTRTSFTIDVASRFVFDKQKFKSEQYILSLLARNPDGTYCLFSNMFGGSGAVITKENIARNEFSVTTSLLSGMTFECAFE